jgi:hypothetical protein
MDSGVLTAASISIGQTIFGYSYFLPPLAEVRKASADNPDIRGDVLLGQIAAAGVSTLVGGLLTWMTSSMVPIIVTALIAMFIGALYQYALNGNQVMS